MLIIIVLLSLGYSIKVENGEQYLKIIEVTKEEHHIEMLPLQTKRVFKYNDSKTTIGLQVNTNESLLQCSGFGRNILFDPYDRNYIKILNMSTHSYYSDDSLKLHRNVNSPGYFASNPILIGVVNTTFGIILLSSDHILHVVNITYSNQSNKFRNESSQNYNFSYLRQTQYEQTTAQLLWDDIKNIVFIIYPQQVVIGTVNKGQIKFHNSNISIVDEQAYLGVGKIYRGYLLLARGRLGIDIYSISDSGELILMKNLHSQLDIPNINIIDFDFGGFDHNYIFVLDQYLGMMIYMIEIAKFQVTKWLDDLIPLQNGKLIKVYQRTILILQEHNSYNQISEFCIYTQDKKLFYMKTHYLDGKYFDIDVEDQFAIVRGYDSHKIIYHSINQNFEQFHNNPVNLENWMDEKVLTDDQEEYLTIPQLQSFILAKYDEKEIMIAVTSKNLVFLRYLKFDPYVECTLSNKAKEGSEISLNATLNSTWCEEKSQYEIQDHKEKIYLNLVMCQKQVTYLVNVGKSLETERNSYFFYVTITVVSLVLLVGLLLILKHYFTKYNERNQDLDQIVADLQKKTYEQECQVCGL